MGSGGRQQCQLTDQKTGNVVGEVSFEISQVRHPIPPNHAACTGCRALRQPTDQLPCLPLNPQCRINVAMHRKGFALQGPSPCAHVTAGWRHDRRRHGRWHDGRQPAGVPHIRVQALIPKALHIPRVRSLPCLIGTPSFSEERPYVPFAKVCLCCMVASCLMPDTRRAATSARPAMRRPQPVNTVLTRCRWYAAAAAAAGLRSAGRPGLQHHRPAGRERPGHGPGPGV